MSMDQFDTLNMRSATLERVLRQIKEQLEDENYTPISIIGKSGIGKTESIANLTKEMGIGFKEIRLSHYQESDLIGLPYIIGGVTKHASADLLPASDDKGQGVLLLDEVTSSTKNMRSAVYQLLDSRRRIGEYILPERWLVVACGNGPQDGGDFRGIEAAFMSRGFCWRVEPNLATWKNWALKAGVHPTVIAFLTFMPDKLHVMDPDSPYDMIACPRNWTKLSIQLKNMEKRVKGGIITDDDDLEFSAAGCVGANVGPTFSAFYRYNKEVIDPQEIIDGKVKPDILTRVTDEVLYITAQNIVHLMSEDIKKNAIPDAPNVTPECFKRVANLMNWIVDMVDAGVRLDVATTITIDLASAIGSTFQSIILEPTFDDICPRFAKFALDNKLLAMAI